MILLISVAIISFKNGDIVSDNFVYYGPKAPHQTSWLLQRLHANQRAARGI